MNQPLQLLMVEDSADDATLLRLTLQRAGYDVTSTVVETPEAMRKALETQPHWDVITSDHAMPRFSAPEALELAKELRPDVPFIIASGEINLNLAVSLMRGGAKDYIQKDELARLIPAVERELKEMELRRDRQRVNTALAESDNRFREVLENSQDAAYKRNLQSNRYDYLSPVFTHIFGYTWDEMNSMTLDEVMALVHASDQVETSRVLEEAISGKTGTAYQVEYRFRHKASHYLWILDKFTVIRDAADRPMALIGSISDITGRKLVEAALRNSHVQMKIILDNLQDAYFQADVSGNFIMANPAAASMYGYRSPEEMIGMPARTLYATRSDRDLLLNELKKNNRVSDWLTRGVRSDGTPIWISMNVQFIRDTNGEIMGTEGVVRDITERKLAEEALRESERRYKTLFDHNTSVTLIIDPDTGAIQDANPAALAYYGWTREQLLSMKIAEINTLNPAEILVEMTLARTEKRNHFEFKHRRADGSICDVEVFSGPLELSGKTLLYSIVRDTKGRKLAEKVAPTTGGEPAETPGHQRHS